MSDEIKVGDIVVRRGTDRHYLVTRVAEKTVMCKSVRSNALTEFYKSSLRLVRTSDGAHVDGLPTVRDEEEKDGS